MIKTISLLLLLGFSVNALNYDSQLGLKVLHYCKASYCSKSTLESWTCGPTCDYFQMKDVNVYFNKTHDIQAFTAYDEGNNYIVAAFRGTSNIENWIQDAKFFHTEYPGCSGCRVHLGFYEAWQDMKTPLLHDLSELLLSYPTAQLVVTGHSLGGAMATIAALDIHKLEINVDILYTFGSPRVGNKEFSEYFHQIFPEAVRVVHNKDIVPHNPSRILGYWHVYTEVWLDEHSSVKKICTTSADEDDCSYSALICSVSDHLDYYNINTGCDGQKLDNFDQMIVE